jgi:hypothetical protein
MDRLAALKLKYLIHFNCSNFGGTPYFPVCIS